MDIDVNNRNFLQIYNRNFLRIIILYHIIHFYHSITTTQENVSEDEVIDQISRECCNDDREKGKNVYKEAVNVLREM
jgi:hypothetical protein